MAGNVPSSGTHVCAHTQHTLVPFSKEKPVTDHVVVQILSYWKAFVLMGKQKGITMVSVATMHADELLEKGIWQNEKQGMKGP